MRSLVHKAYEQIETTGRVKLFKSYNAAYADGEQKRDFLYIKDAVNMTLHLAETKTANGLFNIGSGEANTWNTLVSNIFKALGKPTNIEYIEMPESLQAKYQYYTCADISKIRSTGYDAPMTSLADAIKEYVQDYIAPSKHLGS
jgi:ADP-L-glycero-D-manno-heptose 6-epimerase